MIMQTHPLQTYHHPAYNNVYSVTVTNEKSTHQPSPLKPQHKFVIIAPVISHPYKHICTSWFPLVFESRGDVATMCIMVRRWTAGSKVSSTCSCTSPSHRTWQVPLHHSTASPREYRPSFCAKHPCWKRTTSSAWWLHHQVTWNMMKVNMSQHHQQTCLLPIPIYGAHSCSFWSSGDHCNGQQSLKHQLTVLMCASFERNQFTDNQMHASIILFNCVTKAPVFSVNQHPSKWNFHKFLATELLQHNITAHCDHL